MEDHSVSLSGMSDKFSNVTEFEVIHHDRQTYPESLSEQERFVAELLEGKRGNTLILTEHPPVYTLGTSGSASDVLVRNIDGERIDVFESGRGGEVTYHGPGQLVCYVIVDISSEQDLHRHVWRLEEMVIRTLSDFGIEAGRNDRGIGVWVGDKKIAAVGVRCRKWVTYHGIALNIHPNMKHFQGIITCGMEDRPVTSMHRLGTDASRVGIERRIRAHAEALFAKLDGSG
jgi:lipoyl(octanoyl) transferase